MTQAQAAAKALALLNGLIVTLARRRPAKFPPYAADGAMEQFRIAQLHIQRGLDIYERHQGPLNRKVTRTDCVEEISA